MKIISKTEFSTYHNHRAEPYFTFVKSGEKTVEGRINKGYYQLLKPNDHIIIYNEVESDSIEVIVKAVRLYKSIKEMLETEPLEKLLPDAKNIEEGERIYKKFYTSEQEREFGVIAIEITKSKSLLLI